MTLWQSCFMLVIYYLLKMASLHYRPGQLMAWGHFFIQLDLVLPTYLLYNNILGCDCLFSTLANFFSQAGWSVAKWIWCWLHNMKGPGLTPKNGWHFCGDRKPNWSLAKEKYKNIPTPFWAGPTLTKQLPNMVNVCCNILPFLFTWTIENNSAFWLHF